MTIYGNNKKAGKYIKVNGVKVYCEIYGKGEPLVLIHGNGGSIAYMASQIEYFSKNYKVIAVDSRGRGNSELGEEKLTFFNMAKDIAGVLDFLKLKAAYYIGRSDGGIIALMMAVHFPEKVKKIAAFGTNVTTGLTALYPAPVEYTHNQRVLAEKMLAQNDSTKDWNLLFQRYSLMEFQPQFTEQELMNIEAPVLVLSCDRDIIQEEHTLYIYKTIPNTNLCIFPSERHSITKDNPQLFNSTVASYFDKPFAGEEIRN